MKKKKKKDSKEVIELKDIIQELYEDSILDDRIRDLIKDSKDESDIMYASHLIMLRDKVKEVLLWLK